MFRPAESGLQDWSRVKHICGVQYYIGLSVYFAHQCWVLKKKIAVFCLNNRSTSPIETPHAWEAENIYHESLLRSSVGQVQKKWSPCVTWGSKIQTAYIFTMCLKNIVPVFYHDYRWNYGLMSLKKALHWGRLIFSEPALWRYFLEKIDTLPNSPFLRPLGFN